MFFLGLTIVAVTSYALLIIARLFGLVDFSWAVILAPIWVTILVVGIWVIGAGSFLWLISMLMQAR